MGWCTLPSQRSWIRIGNRSLHILFFRFLGGIGVGASTVAAPTYISEISTAKSRGRLVALYQFNIVFGILVAFISNYLLSGIGGANDWRWMLGVEALPAALYCLLILECLNLLVGYWFKRDELNALKTLKLLHDDDSAALAELEMIKTHEDTTRGISVFGKYKKFDIRFPSGIF